MLPKSYYWRRMLLSCTAFVIVFGISMLFFWLCGVDFNRRGVDVALGLFISMASGAFSALAIRKLY